MKRPTKDTIQTWCFTICAATAIISSFIFLGMVVRALANREPAVEAEPQYTYNPWEAALTVCSDTYGATMSGTWDPVCFLTIKELATRDWWGTGNRADKQTCRDIYAMVSDELSLKDKYQVVVCGR